ncbi:tetratricopeptide repeat protein [Verrucomicrobiota bacterium]
MATDTQPARKQLLVFALVIGLAVFAFQCGFFHISCVDTGFHIQTGALMLRTGRIASQNTFSWISPDSPWHLHQWGPATLYYIVFAAWGLTALIAFKALLAAAIFIVTWLTARREAPDNPYLPFWTVTGGLIAARCRFFVRPLMFSALLLALLIYIHRRFRGSRRWEWIGLPVLMTIWSNTHAGVLYGFAFLGAVAAAPWLTVLIPRLRPKVSMNNLFQLPIGIAISLAASAISLQLINPLGVMAVLRSILYAMDPFWRDAAVELGPPTGIGMLIVAGTVVAVLILQATRIRKIDLSFFLPFAGFAFLALRSQRALLTFTIVTIPYLTGLLAAARLPSPRRGAAMNACGLVVAWVAVFACLILPDKLFLYGPGLFRNFYPMSVFRFMNRNVERQNIYNEMVHGGPILWWLYPEFRPFIDSRGDAYTTEFWRDTYYMIRDAKPGWQQYFSQHGIGVALVADMHGHAPLADQLYDDADWALVSFEDHARLFVKRTPENMPVVTKHEYNELRPHDRSLAWINNGNAPAVIAEAARAVAADPEGITARTALARAHMMAGNHGDAVPVYEDLLADMEDAAGNYWRDYGYCLFVSGDHNKASEVYTHMINAEIEPAFAWYMRHFLALKRDDPAEARKCLEKAVQLAPDETIYTSALARLGK